MKKRKIVLCTAKAGEMNEIAHILDLTKLFDFTICEEGIDVAAKIVKEFSADLLVVDLGTLPTNSMVSVMSLQIEREDLPILVYGDALQYADFLSKYMGYPLNQLEKPAVLDKVINTFIRALKISLEELKKPLENVPRQERKNPFGDCKVEPKILVVDDEPMMLKFVKRMLDPYCQLRTTTNGENAIKMIEMERPDVILLDYMMPGMDGVEVLKEIRQSKNESDYSPGIIFVTGVDNGEQIKTAMQLEPDAYLLKPVKAAELIPAIRRAIQKRKKK